MTIRGARVLLGLATVLAAGCSYRPRGDGGESRVLMIERVPEVLSDPSGAVFAEAGDFVARIERVGGGKAGSIGTLAARQGKLFYAPGVRQKGEAVPDSEAVFVWDPRTGQGFVASDALQGYAPLTNGFRATSVTAEPVVAAAVETVSGHACDAVVFRVRSGAGHESRVEARRAIDLAGFPVRLESDGADGRHGFLASDVRRELPPSAWFEPPAGYTRYESASAMVGELLVRESSGRGGRGAGPGDPGAVRGRGRGRGRGRHARYY